jgi:hypothetical protein
VSDIIASPWTVTDFADDLRKTCPWYFEFRELDEMTDDEPTPITAPAPAPQPPAPSAIDPPTSTNALEASSSSAKETKKSKKALKAEREAAASQEASSSKNKSVVPKSEMIYIDDTSSEAELGPNDDIHIYSEHEMEYDIVEITDALGSGHASADTEAVMDAEGVPRRQNTGVKREREETPLLDLTTKKKGRKSKSVLDSEADGGTSNDDTTVTRSRQQTKSAHLATGQANAATSRKPHLDDDSCSADTATYRGLATETGLGDPIVKEERVGQEDNGDGWANKAEMMRQLGAATRPHKPKNEGDVPKIFSFPVHRLDEYLAAPDDESKTAVLHEVQVRSMRIVLFHMQKEE